LEDNKASVVTLILGRITSGDAAAKEELVAEVYNELRRLAAAYMKSERPGHTLQPTALVHEAYVRLLGDQKTEFKDRVHFFAVASQVMRRLLVDHARKRMAEKRGAGLVVTLNENLDAATAVNKDVLLVDEVLGELAQLDARAALVVQMKFFGGMTETEIGEALGVHRATARKDWAFARAWLFQRLDGSPQPKAVSA